MVIFEWGLLLLLGAVLLALLARRFGLPYPAFLAVGGALVALLPGLPRLDLNPELVLALFVAPVLLDAAYDTSLRDLRENWRPIGGLVLVAVLVTTGAVAVVARHLVPDLPWAAAIALGAIVAPPDGAAAIAVLRHLQPPYRITVILEGESLLNDASSLLIYRFAVAAAAAGGVSLASAAPTFALVLTGSVLGGYAVARLYHRLLMRVADLESAVVLQFIGTFGIWLAAERLHLSGIITVVVYGMTLARYAPDSTQARLRVSSYAVWGIVTFVLNVLAFTLIGLQLRPIIERLSAGQLQTFALVAGAVLATVVLVRFVWVMGYNTIARMWIARFGFHPSRPAAARPTVQGGILISWCGMRGIVTLAAALALPEGFPYRDMIVLTAFAVVVGTLVGQGLTVNPLLRWLTLEDDDPVGQEVKKAREVAFTAALKTIDGNQTPAAESLRREYQSALDRSRRNEGHARDSAENELRRKVVEASRHAISDLRHRGKIADIAFHQVEKELDWLELSAVVEEEDDEG